MNKKNFFDFNFEGLRQFLIKDLSIEDKKISMRSKQIWQSVYKKGLFDINNLTTLPTDLRNRIDTLISLKRPEITKTQKSTDGTIKWLIKLFDGNEVECVYIPEKNRATLCISSQVGCTLNCKFCHTGVQPLVKNLSAHEIVNQILIAKDELKEWNKEKKINNIVYMGMGEPFYNFENIKKSIEILKDMNGLGFSNKRITVSTSGISPNIKKAAKEIGTYLALSLHAPNNKIRDSIMPINKKYNIEDVIMHCKEYAIENGEKIFIEYVLLKDVNDSEECAKQLSKIMSQFPCKLNLIQFNPWPGVKYKTSSTEQTSKFMNIIKGYGHIVTLRKSRGDDILGACGQLKTASEREKGLTLSK